MLLCLPHEAFFSGAAILRTLWRMVISRRGLLEWNPSGEADRGSRTDLAGSFRNIWIAPVIAFCASGYLLSSRPHAFFAAAPILSLWFVSPLVTWWISKPLALRKARLTEEQIVFLRKLSRKTWTFFEALVRAGDHWLPPDNYQEEPVAVLAHRTSPTNMGLALLANLSAYDFGYISVGQFIERTSGALRTMASLPKHPRSLLQLVRHRVPETPATHVCFVGGQRKSGSKSSHPTSRIARAARRKTFWGHGFSTVWKTRSWCFRMSSARLNQQCWPG